MKMTLIEWVLIGAILTIIAAIAIPFIVKPSTGAFAQQTTKPTVEQKIDVGWGMNAKIIVLPTGERVLLITGSEGLATCCLLPPLAPPTVEKGPTP